MTRPTLSEPIIIAEWWKNRGGESIRTLSTYQGRNIADLRVWYTSPEGKLKPSAKGLTAEACHLPQLTKAIVKAEAKARELHLIDDDHDGGEK
jgi:Transcriptional Coactivator p15 (PC4)